LPALQETRESEERLDSQGNIASFAPRAWKKERCCCIQCGTLFTKSTIRKEFVFVSYTRQNASLPRACPCRLFWRHLARHLQARQLAPTGGAGL
jgi:hypothetical protein